MCMCVKKMVVFAITMSLSCCISVQAANVSRISRDAKLQSALTLLERNGSENLVSGLERHRIQVRFYDLNALSYEYGRHYAMRVETQTGNHYILINSRFEDAPTEAIACLIAHEAVHNLPNATFAEEVMATTVEAKTWLQLRNSVDYTNSADPLVKRLNRNANRYLTSSNGISNAIAQNPTYRKQFKMY